MSIRIDQRALRVELALRGWSQLDLATHSKISEPTANVAATNKPISTKTFKKIVDGLGLDEQGARRLIIGLDGEALAS